MYCLRCGSARPEEKYSVKMAAARRIVLGSAFTSGTIEVCSPDCLGRESRIETRRCHVAEEDAGALIVAVLARRSTTMLVVPAADGGKRNVATSPTESWDDC